MRVVTAAALLLVLIAGCGQIPEITESSPTTASSATPQPSEPPLQSAEEPTPLESTEAPSLSPTPTPFALLPHEDLIPFLPTEVAGEPLTSIDWRGDYNPDQWRFIPMVQDELDIPFTQAIQQEPDRTPDGYECVFAVSRFATARTEDLEAILDFYLAGFSIPVEEREVNGLRIWEVESRDPDTFDLRALWLAWSDSIVEITCELDTPYESWPDLWIEQLP